ncbi:hypothetical protein V6N13_071666 [Hibiscus sabdariffa]
MVSKKRSKSENRKDGNDEKGGQFHILKALQAAITSICAALLTNFSGSIHKVGSKQAEIVGPKQMKISSQHSFSFSNNMMIQIVYFRDDNGRNLEAVPEVEGYPQAAQQSEQPLSLFQEMSARWRKGRNDRDQLCNPPPLPTPHLLALFPIPPGELHQLRPPSPGPSTAAPSDVSVELTLGLNPSCSETALFQEILKAEMGGGNEPREGSSWWLAAAELGPVFNQEQEPQPSSPTLPYPSYPRPKNRYQERVFRWKNKVSLPNPFTCNRPPEVATGEPSPQRPTPPLLPLFPPEVQPLRPPSPTLGPGLSLPVPSESDASLGLKPCGSETPSHAEPESLFIKVHRMVSKQGRRHGNDKKRTP